jgi:hypothetical protein
MIFSYSTHKIRAMIVIAAVYHEYRYLTSVAHAQFAYLVDIAQVKRQTRIS